MEDRHLSLSEVAGLLGVSERTVRRWIKAGKLRAYKPGRDYRIPESAVRTLVEESEISPKALAPPSLFNGLEEERRAGVEKAEILKALADYWNRRAAYHEAEVRDPKSPFFRNATMATLWLHGLRREQRTWAEWALAHASVLLPSAAPRGVSPGADLDLITASVLVFGSIAGRAEKRIATMADAPDQLAERRMQEERTEAEEAARRLEDLSATG